MYYLFLTAAAWFWCNFEPLHAFIDKVFDLLWIKSSVKTRDFLSFIHNALSCPQCVGFWLTLILTNNLFESFVVSLSTHVLDLCLQKLK